MCVTVFVGFAPSFYLRPLLQDRFGLPPLPSRLVVVHGVVFSAWMLLLLLQTSLVAARRVRWHRRTGVGAAIVAALMVIIGVAAQVAQTHRTVASGEYETTILLENGLTIGALLNITLFGALTAAAVHFRRRPDVHRRLVVLANIPLLLAAVGRIIFIFGLPQALLYVFPQPAFIAALATNDLRTDRRVHPATLWASIPIIAIYALPLTPLYGSAAASAFTRWVAALVS
jgi:hypothetical protein